MYRICILNRAVCKPFHFIRKVRVIWCTVTSMCGARFSVNATRRTSPISTSSFLKALEAWIISVPEKGHMCENDWTHSEKNLLRLPSFLITEPRVFFLKIFKSFFPDKRQVYFYPCHIPSQAYRPFKGTVCISEHKRKQCDWLVRRSGKEMHHSTPRLKDEG